MQLSQIIENNAELLEGKKDKVIGIYYASELHGCQRKIYYSYLEKPKYKFNVHKSFFIGNALHELVQSIAFTYSQKVNGIVVQNEIKDMTYIEPETKLEIHGRLDTLIIEKLTGKVHIFEIKTTSNLNYAPIKEHYNQLNYYLYFNPDTTGKFHPFDLDYEIEPKVEGHLFYINTSKKKYNEESYLEFKEVPASDSEEPILFDRDLFLADVKRAKVLHQYLLERKVPPPEAKLSVDMFWQCPLCPFKNKCDIEENTKIIGEKNYNELAKKIKKK